MKQYRLLKEMPTSKVGDVFNFDGGVCTGLFYHAASGARFTQEFVENNPDWFEEVNTVEKERIEVIKFKHNGADDNYLTSQYKFNTRGGVITEDKFPAIKKAIEQVLNPEPSSKKEEGWEIVEIVDTYYSNSIISKENKLGVYSLKDYLTKYEKGRFKINAVLRKSDNTVFTVGDEVGYKINDTKFIVKTIKISGEPYLLDGDTFHKHLLPLRNAIKAPTNTVEDKPFVWTDELVKKYVCTVLSDTIQDIEYFKSNNSSNA